MNFIYSIILSRDPPVAKGSALDDLNGGDGGDSGGGGNLENFPSSNATFDETKSSSNENVKIISEEF